MAKSIDKPRPSKIDGPIDFDSKVRILDSSSLYEKNAEIVAYMRLPSTSAKPNPKTHGTSIARNKSLFDMQGFKQKVYYKELQFWFRC